MAVATDGIRLVAAGFGEDAPSERIWTTEGAASWQRATVEAAGADSSDQVVAAAGRWFAIGTAVDAGVLWVSADGADWRRDADMSGPRIVVSAVGTDRGLVALGSADGIPVAWTSRDGAAWGEAATDFRLQDPELAVIDDRVVAVGREGAWISDPITPGVDIR
jgi:hypothetical protein